MFHEPMLLMLLSFLTHWGRVTHICVSKLTIIGSDNVLSPGRRQAIIWTNAGILLIGPLRTNLSEIFIEIYTFSFKKMHFKMTSGKWQPFCLGPNVLALRWHRVLKSFINKDLFIPHTYLKAWWLKELGQYHGWWCHGETRSQGISSHDIDIVLP